MINMHWNSGRQGIGEPLVIESAFVSQETESGVEGSHIDYWLHVGSGEAENNTLSTLSQLVVPAGVQSRFDMPHLDLSIDSDRPNISVATIETSSSLGRTLSRLISTS